MWSNKLNPNPSNRPSAAFILNSIFLLVCLPTVGYYFGYRKSSSPSALERQLQAQLEAERRLRLEAEERTADAIQTSETSLEAQAEIERTREKALEREEVAKGKLDREKLKLELAEIRIEILEKKLERVMLENSGMGIRPVEWPMQRDLVAAFRSTQYDPNCLHIAVCGAPGSGKSTLLNALRGITKSHELAAEVGVTETTKAVTTYSDPRSKGPYSKCLWYDIPGISTLTVSHSKYFTNQGLFVFDLLVLVYDWFREIDVGIVENCFRFGIQVFVVRSKADQHVTNMLREEGNLEEGRDRGYQLKAEYIRRTRNDFERNIQGVAEKLKQSDAKIEMLPVYIISGSVLREIVASAGTDTAEKGSEKEGEDEEGKEGGVRDVIDEKKLFKHVTKAVVSRNHERMAAAQSKAGLLAAGEFDASASPSTVGGAHTFFRDWRTISSS